MTYDTDGDDSFEAQVDALEDTLDSAGTVVAAFGESLRTMQVDTVLAGNSVGKLSTSISGGLRRAFDGLVFDGMKASDALGMVAQSIVNASYSAAIQPVSRKFGDIIANGIVGIGGAAFADGGSFAQGRVMPFAKGGVVTGPTRFPMQGGAGLMGEAGPEAIMPLTRGADGSLGVRAQGGAAASPQVTINIQTPDVDGFRRSQSQIAAQFGRALGRGQRNR